MAIVKLDKVSVVSLHQSGHSLTVKEQDRGEFKGQRFALWFKEPTGLSVGDVVSVSGFLSAKVGKPYTGNDGVERVGVDLSVNSPKLDGFPEKGNEPVQSAVEQVWPATDEVPF